MTPDTLGRFHEKEAATRSGAPQLMAGKSDFPEPANTPALTFGLSGLLRYRCLNPGRHVNLVSVSGRQPILEVFPQRRGARLAHCIIRYNLSGVFNRRLTGDAGMKLATIVMLTFLLSGARRYEHAGCANRIHCR